MCTLAVEFRPGSAHPLVVAANRDESKSRPASGLRWWPEIRCVAPRDELEGGTWLGVNAHGLFVGITNRFMSAKHEGRRSRGHLVLDALKATSAAALAATMRALPAHTYNDFHLLYADAREAFVSWSADDVLSHQSLQPGLHVVTERSLQRSTVAREALVRSHWPADAAAHPEALMQLLAEKREPSFDGLTVNVPEFNYGTRSAFVFIAGPELQQSRCWFAAGAPDVTPFEEHSALLAGASKI